jgi:hypothetical protein
MRNLLKYMLIFFLFPMVAEAQTYEISKDDCDQAKFYRLKNGATLIVKCREVFVYTEAAEKLRVANQIKGDSLQTLKEQYQAVKDSMFAIQDSIAVHLDRVIKIQNTAYDSLYKRFNAADSLVIRATDNTDKALGLITRMKIVSAVSGGVMGAVAGGVVGGRIESSEGFRFNWPGALIGGVVGAATNFWLMKKL